MGNKKSTAGKGLLILENVKDWKKFVRNNVLNCTSLALELVVSPGIQIGVYGFIMGKYVTIHAPNCTHYNGKHDAQLSGNKPS